MLKFALQLIGFLFRCGKQSKIKATQKQLFYKRKKDASQQLKKNC